MMKTASKVEDFLKSVNISPFCAIQACIVLSVIIRIVLGRELYTAQNPT